MLTLRTTTNRLAISSLAVAVVLAGSAPVLAGADNPSHQHGEGPHGGAHASAETAIGMSGKTSDAKRTINVIMQDNFFEPEEITVAAGETVRFKIVNNGTLLHEFGLGTPAMHTAHQKAMVMMMKQGMIKADRINTERMTHVMPDGTVMQGAKHGSHGQEHSSHGPAGQTGATHVMPDGTVMQGAKHIGYGDMGHGSGQGDMGHMHGAESGSVLVEPGKSAEIIWTFSKQMKLEFACNVPGHYEAGMVGPLTVQ